MSTPITKSKPESKRCPNAPQKNRIVDDDNDTDDDINNAENLVSQSLSDIFNRYRNVPGAPTKVRVQVARDDIVPVDLRNEFNAVRDAPRAPVRVNHNVNRDYIQPVRLF